MTTLEDMLAGWTGPSSDTEQEKQERTERMVREAVAAHEAFKGYRFRTYAKGSYANNTNVKTDSDVDIAVQCQEAEYWWEENPGAHSPVDAYEGIWTPSYLRSELHDALDAKFPGQVDASGRTAFQIKSSTSRVDADVVPAFDLRDYFSNGYTRAGSRIFKSSLHSIDNYPDQHLANGRDKNDATRGKFKKTVRILKRVENAMVEQGLHEELVSYFVECLVYNCPKSVFDRITWTDVVRQGLIHIWNGLEGSEPSTGRWLEVNECKFLFDAAQPWTREQGRAFAGAAWNFLGFTS